MARLRAVVVIQPPGFGGTPVTGHRSAAMANASATASSARSMSPRTRIKVAVQRPASRRKTAARSSLTLERADLDGSLAGGRTPCAAQSSAASRSAASMTQKPPICSLVSA